jgi:hypothetical protein
MGMTILTAPQGLLAVVAVPAPDPMGADLFIQRVHKRGIPPKRGYVISRRKEMARIKTESHSGVPLKSFQYIRKMFKFVPQKAPLPGHGLQKDPNPHARSSRKDLFKPLHDSIQPSGLSALPMASGMKYQILNAQSITPIYLIFQSLQAPAAKLLLRSRKVDKVSRMSHHLADGAPPPGFDKAHFLSRSQGSGFPLKLVLRKYLESLAAELLSSFESPVEPPSDGNMHTDQRHRWGSPFLTIDF